MKNILLAIVPFLLINNADAQLKADGYILTKKRDTVYGVIYVPKKRKTIKMEALYSVVNFSDSGGTKKKYTSTDIWGFGVRSEFINEDFITPRALGEQSQKFFFRRMQSGYIELFELYSTKKTTIINSHGYESAPTYGTMRYSDRAFYIKVGWKDSERLFGNNFIYEKDYLISLLKNHPDLVKKIESDVDITTLSDLINEYNLKYTSSNYQ